MARVSEARASTGLPTAPRPPGGRQNSVVAHEPRLARETWPVAARPAGCSTTRARTWTASQVGTRSKVAVR